ncbi:nuclear transport factor 2 family protein [Streptacidiphilus melanogenes]|uniref:nuclear transport factor 2 family protein n=1 Tax=Streptacidiphilus melanogenes TaxID=411235 RepID=UPI0005A943E7|nr:nuclear transport factor 2 family protein [Streptacidiphilus melanogenes]
MDLDNTERFVNSWASAWNTHDVEAVLAHFDEDVTFSSPVAARVLGGDGVVHGKDALRAYWTRALALVPDLRFEVLGSYAGVDCLVIHYRNQVGGLVNEVLVFDGPLVVRGYGTYLGGDRPSPAGID